jgi:hypothetical protein
VARRGNRQVCAAEGIPELQGERLLEDRGRRWGEKGPEGAGRRNEVSGEEMTMKKKMREEGEEEALTEGS